MKEGNALKGDLFRKNIFTISGIVVFFLLLFAIRNPYSKLNSNKELLNKLKNENKQLKQENVKLLKNNEKLKKENIKLLEANEGLKNKQSTNVDNLPYPISAIVEGNTNPDLNKVARELFSNYLNYYKNDNGNSLQLKDYTIDKINIERSDKSSFVFYVDFSVQPNDADTWMAGNGIQFKNGWIHSKVYFVKVGIKDHTYTMESHGTSP